MEMIKTYAIGEQVMIKVKVIKKSFDDHGRIKYQLKDEKSNSLLRWEYTEDDIIPVKTTVRKKSSEKKVATSKIKVAQNKKDSKE